MGKSDKDVGKRGPLSGMRGVVLGAGLGWLAAKKGGPLAQKAMLKYVASHAMDATGQVAGGTPKV